MEVVLATALGALIIGAVALFLKKASPDIIIGILTLFLGIMLILLAFFVGSIILDVLGVHNFYTKI